MEEIFELIKAFNRLKDKILEMSTKIDLFLKSSSQQSSVLQKSDEYVEEEGACRILHVCPRTLAKLRANRSIPYIKQGRNCLYLAGDLYEYLERVKVNQ
jgi:hypothetical protein